MSSTSVALISALSRVSSAGKPLSLAVSLRSLRGHGRHVDSRFFKRFTFVFAPVAFPVGHHEGPALLLRTEAHFLLLLFDLQSFRGLSVGTGVSLLVPKLPPSRSLLVLAVILWLEVCREQREDIRESHSEILHWLRGDNPKHSP